MKRSTRMKYTDRLVSASAALSMASLAAVNLTGFTALQPTLSEVAMGTIGLWIAHHGVKKVVDHHDAEPTPAPKPAPLIDVPLDWDTSDDDSYCQWCDDVHPTEEFSLDILGRWVCLECRRLVDPEYSPPSAAPPTPPNGFAAQKAVEYQKDHAPQPCLYCQAKSKYFVRLPGGDHAHMCQRCIDDMSAHKVPVGERDNELLEATHKRLDKAEKLAARKGKSVEVAGGEYVRSMYGKDVTVKGVDKGGIVKVDGADCRARVSGDVLELGRVIASGGDAEIIIDGNVGRGAKIRCSGGGARIVISGHIGPDADVRASGGDAKVTYGSKDSSARVDATGGSSNVVCKGRKKVADSSFDVQPGQVWETPEEKRPTGEDKPPCQVCGAPSYYFLLIPHDNGTPSHGEHRCVRCSQSLRNYSPEERKQLELAAKQDEINQLAAIHQVPAPIVGEDSSYDKVIQTAEMLTSRFRNLVPDEYIGLLRDDGKHR